MLKKSLIICTILISFSCCNAQKITSLLSPPISARWINNNLKDANNNYQFLMQRDTEGVMHLSFANDTLKHATPLTKDPDEFSTVLIITF